MHGLLLSPTTSASAAKTRQGNDWGRFILGTNY